MEIRKPVVDGQFYPSDPEELKEQIKASFLSKFGPGSLPKEGRKKHTAGAIAPHAGYQFSGPGAAWVYKEIAESIIPDTYVLLGPSHSGFSSCISLQDWKTPLGTARNDSEFGKKLADNSGLSVNEEAHSKEHSIEVQLPFLQFACPEFKIVPIMISHDLGYQKIADAIRKTAEQLKRKTVVIASSDFTHYGFAYGYVPFSENIKKNMYSLDKGAIDAIKSLDAEKFISYVNEKQATICGQLPIATLMKAVDVKKAKLLSYYTSGDIIGDYSNAVGYASIVFE
jgi:AmmeMemoRadiSam system protein B